MPTRQQNSRANGALSHGPITAAGKSTSSRNALRHGLSATKLVLPDESLPAFRRLLLDYIEYFQPTSGVERELVHTMALARWRLRRLATTEPHLYSNQMYSSRDYIQREFGDTTHEERLAYAFKSLASQNSLPLLVRYEATLTRTYDRAFKNLESLRAKKQNEPTDFPPSPQSTPIEPSL